MVPIPTEPIPVITNGLASDAISSTLNALPPPSWVMRTISFSVVPENKPAMADEPGTTFNLAPGKVTPSPTSPEIYTPPSVVELPTCNI